MNRGDDKLLLSLNLPFKIILTHGCPNEFLPIQYSVPVALLTPHPTMDKMWLLCNIKQMYKLIKNNNNFQFLGPLNTTEVSQFCLFQFHEKLNHSVLQSIERNGVM